MIWHEYKGEDIDKILELNSSDFNKWVCETMHATCTSCGRDYLYWKNSPALKQEYWKLVLEKLHLVEFEKRANANLEKFRRETNNTSVFVTSCRTRGTFQTAPFRSEGNGRWSHRPTA